VSTVLPFAAATPPLAEVPFDENWAVVVPVKDFRTAKTRLSELSPQARASLASALAMDTVNAVCRAVGPSRCFLVAPDFVHAQLHLLPVQRVLDPGGGINAALVAGRDAAASTGAAVAALVADLPLLSVSELRDALGRVPASSVALVRDFSGHGTTMLAARSSELLRPCFEDASARRHMDLGACDLSDGVGSGLRQDLDTWEDLMTVAPSLPPGSTTAQWHAAKVRRMAEPPYAGTQWSPRAAASM
jgi:2-phospho-L-lactate guanylyltransferase